MFPFLYRASFFLYELSFLTLALTLALQAGLMGRLGRVLRLPPYWLGPAVGAVLLAVCAVLHFYVYHTLSPSYLASNSHLLLLQMYGLKTLSMLSVLFAGGALLIGAWAYLRDTTR